MKINFGSVPIHVRRPNGERTTIRVSKRTAQAVDAYRKIVGESRNHAWNRIIDVSGGGPISLFQATTPERVELLEPLEPAIDYCLPASLLVLLNEPDNPRLQNLTPAEQHIYDVMQSLSWHRLNPIELLALVLIRDWLIRTVKAFNEQHWTLEIADQEVTFSEKIFERTNGVAWEDIFVEDHE